MDVVDWLKERDYWTGVDIFCQLSDNDFLKSIFRSGQSEYNRKKLEEELLSFANKRTEELCTAPATPVADIQEKKYQNQFLLTKLKHELQQIYRQIDDNRFALTRCKTDGTRRDYALQILNLVDKKRIVHEQMDYFDEYGCLPVAEKVDKSYTTPELQRLYVQVYKMRKRLEKPDADLRNRAKSEQKLREKLARIEVLKGEMA